MEPAVSAAIEINRSIQDGKKTKQQKVKDMLVARNEMPLPSNSAKVTAINRGILEMMAVHNRPFRIVED